MNQNRRRKENGKKNVSGIFGEFDMSVKIIGQSSGKNRHIILKSYTQYDILMTSHYINIYIGNELINICIVLVLL